MMGEVTGFDLEAREVLVDPGAGDASRSRSPTTP